MSDKDEVLAYGSKLTSGYFRCQFLDIFDVVYFPDHSILGSTAIVITWVACHSSNWMAGKTVQNLTFFFILIANVNVEAGVAIMLRTKNPLIGLNQAVLVKGNYGQLASGWSPCNKMLFEGT